MKRFTVNNPAKLLAVFVLLTAHVALQAQQPAQGDEPVQASHITEHISEKAHRRAARLYIDGAKAAKLKQTEQALDDFSQALQLDPKNPDYVQAVAEARAHLVTELIQQAAKLRIEGDSAASSASLRRALEIDPQNPFALQHIEELSSESIPRQNARIIDPSEQLASPIHLKPDTNSNSFHLRTDGRSIVQQVFKAYGIEASIDQSVPTVIQQIDTDDATFPDAARIAMLLTNSFYVPLDPHRVLIARDTRENRKLYEPQSLETIYLHGVSKEEMTAVSTMAKNVFDLTQAAPNEATGSLTVRAPEKTLTAFKQTLDGLSEGRDVVMLHVRIIQLAHINDREMGLTTPTSSQLFDVGAEASTFISQNQSLVDEIIASGLASADDPLAIAAIIIASGEASSSVLSEPFATFGNNCTSSSTNGCLSTYGLEPGSMGLTFSLNSSDSRELDDIQLRALNDEAATFKTGERYPITTSSFSSLTSSSVSGLSTSGLSSSLSSLLTSATSSTATVPQIEYEDLGLTLKATPKVLRTRDIALTLDLKIQSLAGTSLNGIPTLTNRQISNVVTVREGDSTVVVTNLNKQEANSTSGSSFLAETPGLNDIDDTSRNQDVSRLLILITPQIVRETFQKGRGPMLMVDKAQGPGK